MSRLKSLALPLILSWSFVGLVEAQDCTLTRPGNLPVWSMSGTWSGDTLLLADSFGRSLLRYSRANGFMGRENSTLSSLMSLRPYSIQPFSAGLVLQFEDSFMVMDSKMRPLSHRLTFIDSDGDGTHLGAVNSWAAGGGLIYGCADFQQAGTWQRGIVRFKPAEPEQFVPLEILSSGHPMMLHCRLGTPMMAAIGSVGYALMMDDRPVIEAYDPTAKPALDSGRSLGNVDLGVRPDIPRYGTSDEYAVTMRAVELATMPMGIYSWKNHLYVLMHEVDDRSEPTWRLLKIDPLGSGAIVADVVLPSKAPHVTVVPGPKDWALVEKDVVREIGEQDVLGIRYIPSSSIDALPHGTVCGAKNSR